MLKINVDVDAITLNLPNDLVQMKKRIQVLSTNYTSIDIRGKDFSGGCDFVTFWRDGIQYHIDVAKTPLNYDGFRYWLV
jgi:hypothetical protein